MRTLLLPTLALLAAAAPAQARPDKPFRLELGAYFPDYRGADFGHDVGGAAALGYDVCRKGDVTLGTSLCGAFHLNIAGGGGSGPDTSGPDFNGLYVSSLFAEVRYQSARCPRLFGGIGLGVGRANVQDSDGHTGFLVALEGGANLTSSVYLAVRYQFAGPDTLRGATASLGFRF